jgi:hypothetical protein
MSEHITHIAVYEDCARIVLNTDKFCEAFRTCIKNEYDSGMLASGATDGGRWAVPILDKYKNGWNDGEQSTEIQQQIAGALGWLTHRASDLQMKPLFEKIEENESGFSSSEMQLYHDAFAMREIYQGGKLSTESSYEIFAQSTLEEEMVSHSASNCIDTNQSETLLAYMWRQEFIELHTFTQENRDIETWVDKFIEYRQSFSEDLREYIEAFQNPDPQKMERYIYGFNHYNTEDEIIQFVRSIQRNQPYEHIDIDLAVEKAEDQSQYAQALRKGYIFIASANDFFTGKMEKDQLYDILDLKEKYRHYVV